MSFSPRRRLLLALGALALALAFGAAYRYGLVRSPGDGAPGEGKEEGRRRGDGIVTVTTAPVRVADVPVTIDAVGTVQAYNSVTLRTQVDGRLIKLAVSEGQDVQKGDLIAQIDPSLYQAQYDQAVAKKAQDEANLANARLDLARYQKLVANKFASHQQYATQKALVSQIEALIRADQAAIDNAKTTLDFATIRSPIDGRAGIRLVDVGNILHPSDQNGILVVNQLKPIYVVFTIPQQALPAAQKAQAKGPARANALGPDNASVLDAGEVSVIDNQIDQATGTARIKATFQNKSFSLWPGQFVNVRIVVDMLEQAVVAPSVTVQRGPNGAFVYVLEDNGAVALKPVVIERQDEANAVIASGVEPGMQVVTSGFVRLSDGAKARVAEPTRGDKDKQKLDKTDGPPASGGERRRRRGDGQEGKEGEKRVEQNGPARPN